MQPQETSITKDTFDWLTREYGQPGGYSHFDIKESVAHEVFTDKVLISTAFLNYASYELSFHQNQLMIKKTRLDDYQLEDQASLIIDDMEQEDWEELDTRWLEMIHALQNLAQLQGLTNARDLLEQLFYDIFEEEVAELHIARLPLVVKPVVAEIWEELQTALQNDHNLLACEWNDLLDTALDELNALAPLQAAGITLQAPSPEAYAHIFEATADPSKGILDFFNQQLEKKALKLVAIGMVLDEYQTFACLPMEDLHLTNAMKRMDELCLVCFF
jgi:hypothetical protein